MRADRIRAIALDLPEVTEGPWYGKPAFKVGGKGFARLHEDGESLVVRMPRAERSLLLAHEPELFFVTEHYRNAAAVLVRLARLTPERAAEVLADARRFVAGA
jgi:hypothetical protein